jgi:uncharacterized protein involved in outer membrane biogenesis
LLSGITIKDFAIKEKDGKTNFVHSKIFKISYDLMPLLHKKLEVSEILLDAPTIRVVRDKAGKFNFNSLPKGAKTEDETKTAKPAALALPIALSVNQIRIANAKITFRDAKKEIPDTDITSDLTLKVRLGRDFDLTKIDFQGHLQAQVDVLYGKIKPHAKITADFDSAKITYRVETVAYDRGRIAIADEAVRPVSYAKAVLQGNVENYLSKPAILLDITSQQLNLDYLAALGAALPQGGTVAKKDKKAPKSGKAKVAIAASLPPGFYAHGVIKIDKALYKKLTINNFVLPYELKDGVLTVHGLAAKTAGGQINSNLRLDLRRPDPAYQGDIQMQAVQVDTLGAGLGQSFANMVAGQLKSNLNFDGAGFDLEKIKKSLSAKASYALNDGRLEKSKLTESIANLVGLPELETIAFKDFSGKVKVKDGKVILNSSMHNDDLSVSTAGGYVDMTGQLSMPVEIKISAAMADRIKGGELSKFLADEQGNTTLHLKIGGSYDHPQVALDEKFIKKQTEKVVKKRVEQEIEKALNKNGGNENAPAMQLLKGLFGN